MTQATIAEHDVLVIGAGPAGINSAYALEKAGISYLVIDRAEIIGSTWANLYPSLKLNTTSFFSNLPEKPFPLRYGIFPSGKQYYQYLTEFVEEHDFNIRLGVEVQRVTPQGKCWRVETSEGVYLYKAVISATGVFGNPVMPAVTGMEDFKGTVIHAHDFKSPEQVAGQRVLVVGNGPSGIDISVATGETSASTHIAIRSGVQLSRRYPYGLPKHVWLMIGNLLPGDWCERLLSFVGKANYGDMSRYGLLPPAPGSGGMTGYQGPELLNAVKVGKVIPINAAPMRFDENGVYFMDDSYYEFDTVIMATGYQPVLQQYLDIDLPFSDEPWEKQSICDWMIGPNGMRGFPLRDTSQHPNGRQVMGYPGLYLVGVFYKGKGAMYNMRVEAAIAAEQISEYLKQFEDKTEMVSV